ncbi:MAG: alpha/beta hydrolase [Candidatus Lokiarchaeota archaeon]|nr:alpha/beta hydrolase [Candidatus Lokiarchaeota archaeon]
MPFIKVNDIKMYYEVHGEGFPFVMIMGLTANVDWWDAPTIEKLSKFYKVIIFDNRGAGRTDKPKMDYSIKLFADDTIELMKALKIQKTHMFGISMGGMIAQELALNYPKQVEKLILCATHCGLSKTILASPEVMEVLTKSRANPTPEEIAKDTIPLLYPKDFIEKNPDLIKDSLEMMTKHPIPLFAYQLQLAAIMKFDACRRIKKLNKSTLIIHGTKDILIPTGNAHILEKRIPNAKKILIDGAGHGLVRQEPEILTRLMLEFLES